MRTTLAAGLLGGAALLIAIAFLARSWTAAALALPILLYLGIGALLAPLPPRIVATRVLSRDRAAVGQEVVVRLRVVNDGPRIPSLEIFDRFPLGLAVTKGQAHAHVELKGRGSVEVTYTVVPTVKGEYEIGPLFARARDPLGLQFEETRIALTSRLVVAPRMEDLRKIQFAPRRVRALLGQIRSRYLGLGLEFFSLRDYVPGDEIRHVNWKATARRDRLMTNEYAAERTGDAIIVLDARKETEVGPVARSTTEFGITCVLSLASKILEMRNRVGLIVQRDVLVRVSPGYGKKQLYKIVDALIHVRSGGEWTLEHVVWILGRFFPRDAQVIIVSPLLDPQALNAVAAMEGRGFNVLVVSPSALEVERGTLADDPDTERSYRILRIEREARIRALRRHADVVDWDPRAPLAVALQGVRPYPRRR